MRVSPEAGQARRRVRKSRSGATQASAREFLSGGGEMGALIRAKDWSQTPLGPVGGWSTSLRMMTSFLLANRFPLLLWWGPDYISIYNDAYRPVLGTKHPWALGQPVRECWAEIWDVLRPLIDTPFDGGPATWMDDLALEINRQGFVEETHFTIAYSPVPDDTAPRGIGGVLATVHEITEKVVGERRTAALRDLGARTGEVKSAEGACIIAAEVLRDHVRDVPFALLYLITADGKQARLAGASGIGAGEAAAPLLVEIVGPAEQRWPLAQALQAETPVTVENLPERFPNLPAGPWSDPPHTAVIVPIKSNIAHQLAGFMIAGASPRLRLDDQYRSFFDLAATQIATAIATARAYEEERRRAEALAEIDRAKTLFFSNVSHEFRTPLTLMLGPLEDALADAGLPAADRDRLDVAHRNSLRLLKLVNTLLDFSRMEAGRAQAVYMPTDLATFTADLAANFHSACERAGLRLIIDCPPLPDPVYVDRDMWEKIVLNLLSNAFKFTFDGSIAVAVRTEKDRAVLTVRDTGIGIRKSELPRIFERFHRVEGARGRTHEGTGIGLSLVQELVKLHGGTIEAVSVVGKGTAFTLSIPFGTAHLPPDRIDAARTQASTATRAEAFVEEALRWLPGGAEVAAIDSVDAVAPGAVAAERSRVLFADDNADMRDYVRRLLGARYEVEEVADGQAAIEAARARRPDLILADAMMPRLDGFGLLREIRGDPELRDIPVIMLSARAGEESRVEGLEAGADDYLAKPFPARELIARVAGNLELSRVRRQALADLRGHERKTNAQKQILEMVATGKPLGETLDALMLFLEEVEPGMRCGILLVTDDGKHFRRGSGPNLPESYHRALDGVPITPPYLGSCGEAAHQCTAVLCPDIANESRYADEWRDLVLSCGIRSGRSTAVQGKDGRVLGSLAMYFDRPRDPNPADPELVALATSLAAIAIERDRAEDILRQQLAGMQRLHALSRSLLQGDDVNSVMHEVLLAAAELLHVDKGSVQICDRSAQGLRLVSAIGFDRAFAEQFRFVGADGFTTCAAALRRRERVIVEDFTGDPAFGRLAQAAAPYGIRAAQSTPLLDRNGAVTAMLTTYFDHPHRPTEHELWLLDLYAELAARVIEGKRAEAALRESEANLETELAATRQLQKISSTLLHQGETETLYRKIVDAAAIVMRSEAASMQILVPGRDELRLLGSKGFHPQSASFWEWVHLDSGSTCGAALKSGQRVVVPDVEACEFMAGTGDLDEYRRSDIRAVQSTPLVSRTGILLGMISTHWHKPHDPSEGDLRLFDVLARQAADLIERTQAEQRLAQSEEQLRLAIEAADIGLWDVDPVNDRLYWPARVKAMFGISSDVPVSMTDFYAGLHPEDRERVRAAFAAALDPGKRALYDVEYRTLGKEDGVTRWVAAKGRGSFDDNGACVRVIGTAIEITSRKHAEQALERASADLHRHASELERFNRAAVGREMRMIELKKEINDLCRRQGKPTPYPLEFERDGTHTDVRN